MPKSPGQILSPKRAPEKVPERAAANVRHTDPELPIVHDEGYRTTNELRQQLKLLRKKMARRPLDQLMKLIRSEPGNGKDYTSHDLIGLYGVQSVYQGLLFVQPRSSALQVCIAGDFNDWNPHYHPMTYDEHRRVWYTVIKVTPGIYRYRLVIDGHWMEDRYNPSVELNPYGDFNNIIEVKTRSP